MKKHITFLLFLLIAVATSAQTLNVVTDNVTYAFPASKVGEMTYKDGTTLTIGGKEFTISDINKIYVDDSEVTDNEVAVTYNSTNATVTVAGNVAQYVTPTVSGAHVSIVQSNTDDVDGNEITYSLSGASSDGEFYMSGKYKCSIDLNGVSLTNKTARLFRSSPPHPEWQTCQCQCEERDRKHLDRLCQSVRRPCPESGTLCERTHRIQRQRHPQDRYNSWW